MSVPTLQRQPPAPTPPEPSPADRRLSALLLAAAAVLGVVALAAALLVTGAFTQDTRTTFVTRTVTTQSGTPGAGLDVASLYAQANAGVADITARSTTTTSDGPFGQPRAAETTDTGTGTVIDRQGRILTADHVVAGATSISVTLSDGTTRSATLLGGDTATDVAVLKIDPSGLTLHPLTLGSLTGHRIGDALAVIGDPFNYDRSLSTGVISGLDRTIQAPNGYTIPHALQTDAAMNPGNSGGPILDAKGDVIGIADQIATGGGTTASSTGVGFAVPIDIAKAELAQLEAGTVPAHASLGVGAADATGTAGTTGAAVQTVKPGGPAARAGIRAGDVITGLGSTPVTGVNDLVVAAAEHRPGERVKVTVVRAGERLTLSVALAEEASTATGG